MRNKYLIIIIVLGVVNLFLGWQVYAGSPDALEPPETTSSYTLADLYNRLSAGTTGSQSTFTEPSSAPGTGTMHTLNDIMGTAPALDNTNGAIATQVISGATFWSLNAASGQWGLQTGTRAPAPVAAFWYKDPSGVAWPNPRFTDNGDGTVTDNLTGLIWLKNANCSSFFIGDNTGTNLRTRNEALTSAIALSTGRCGLSDGSSAGDWQLPNVRELQSLVDYARFDPAVSNTAGTEQWSAGDSFDGVQSGNYWSRNFYAVVGQDGAWYVDLGSGIVGPTSNNQTNTNYVWPVRGGQ